MSLKSDRNGFRKTWLATAVAAALAFGANGAAMANEGGGEDETPAFLQMDDGDSNAAPDSPEQAPEPAAQERESEPTNEAMDSTGEPEGKGDSEAVAENESDADQEQAAEQAEAEPKAEQPAKPDESVAEVPKMPAVDVGGEQIPGEVAAEIGITDDMPQELRRQLLEEHMAGMGMSEPGSDERGDRPFDMKESERMVLEERAQILRDTALWEAKAARASAQAKYQKANSEVLEAQGLSRGANDPEIDKQNKAIAELNAKLQDEKRKGGLRLLSVFGDKGDLAAEVFYNGGKVRVSKGDRVGDIKIVKIEPTRLITYQGGERGEINLSSPGK